MKLIKRKLNSKVFFLHMMKYDKLQNTNIIILRLTYVGEMKVKTK